MTQGRVCLACASMQRGELSEAADVPAAHLCMCSNYSPPGNVVMGTSFQFFKDNVLRTSCQTATADDWCQACSGATCTRCSARASFGLMSNQPIRLDTTTKKVRLRCSCCCEMLLLLWYGVCGTCTAFGP